MRVKCNIMPVFICAGDSITYGLWAESDRWTEKLRVYLEEKSLKQSSREELNTKNYIAVYNLGIPGDTSRGLSERFNQEVLPRLNPEQITTIIIAIGTNDSAYSKELGDFQIPIEETKRNLLGLIEDARRVADNLIVVGLPPVDEIRTDPIYWNPGFSYTNEKIKEYEDAIRDICQKEGVVFIDIFKQMSKKDIPSLMEDGIHPNKKGHQVMFEIIKNYLVQKSVI
jgi:acyl-CoA thioesterase I